jgi:hypothetical protein
MLLAVTIAPAIAAPEESDTVPVNAPVPAVCADTSGADTRKAMAKTMLALVFGFMITPVVPR